MKKSVLLSLLSFGISLLYAHELNSQVVIPIKDNLHNAKTIHLSVIASDVTFVPL